ncbi:MAG: Biotin transporter BioY [Chlamydiales bacterium]|nr:Biotin transporter BioY [Chlamydiales bacterium]
MSSYASLLQTEKKSTDYTYQFLCVLAGSLFLAVMAQFSIPLWFTPVPITLQSFAVLMVGGLLGSKRGALAVMTYLVEGALGLPVFAGGLAGPAVLLGPRGGYLFAFVAAAFLVGWLLERGWKQSYLLTVSTLTLGTLTILAVGTAWLSIYVGAGNALALGFYPFLIGGVCKIAAAALIIPTGRKLTK